MSKRAEVAGLTVAALATLSVGLRLWAISAPPAVAVPSVNAVSSSPQAIPEDELPRFNSQGALVKPTGWEKWVMVGASIGLSYNESARTPAAGEAPGMFHNIFMQPWAYRHFAEKGEFADGTMFVLAMYEAARNHDPARGGFYEGDVFPGIEIHLKKPGVDPTGWAFYNFGATAATASKVPGNAACYSCHATEAAFDNVFTQFYPPLRARLASGAPPSP